jgi:FKBP-type peptidyl-prolyl cis-trans isomerase FklB
MKILALALPLVLAAAPVQRALAEEAKTPPPAASSALPDWLKDPKAQASYAIGLNIGAQMRGDGAAIDTSAMEKGLADAMSGAKPQLSDDQMRTVLNQFQADLEARRQDRLAHLAETNKTEGLVFLKANASKPGVTVLPSGLQYEVLTTGRGPTPTPSDTVVCHYRGTLLNGTEFDSSYSRGAPSTFPLIGLIKGFSEALQLMPTGSKWRIYVPAELAYGDKGAGAAIGPNAVLVFEVELISIQGKG